MSDVSVHLTPVPVAMNSTENLGQYVALFSVSAPGKVILFGEHAVVYGHPAIAVAIDLRCYYDCKLIQGQADDPCRVVVTLKDTDDFSFTVDVPDSSARISYAASSCDELRHRAAMLCDSLLNQSQINPPYESMVRHSVCMCIYLLLRSLQLSCNSCCTSGCGGGGCCCSSSESSLLLRSGLVVDIVVRSEIPIGAGLGSSAAFAVGAATLFQILVGHLPSKEDLFVPDEKQCNRIKQLAHEAEVIVHGTPSGVDTSVITHGGAIYFQRNKSDGTPWIRLFRACSAPRLNLIIVDSNMSRSTKAVVRMMAEQYAKRPNQLNGLFESIGQITKQADQLLLVTPDSGDTIPVLAELIDRNHQLLIALGVSNDTLDRIVHQLSAIGISAKLTGAGFGGCVVGLCRTTDGDHSVEQMLDRAVESMARSGFRAKSVCAFAKGVSFARTRC